MVGDKVNIEWSYTISHNIRTRVFDEASKRLTQNLIKNSSFYYSQVVNCWNLLSQEAMEADSIIRFKETIEKFIDNEDIK